MVGGIFFFIIALVSLQLHAGIKNPYFLPLGEAEAFMANTGIGASESSGAVFYNPGALATLKNSKVSITGASYLYFTVDQDPAFILDNQELRYEASGFISIPSTFVSVFKKSDWTFAFSVLQPDALTLENRGLWETPNTRMNLVQVQNVSELWAGFTASRNISKNTGIGLSLYGVKRNEQSIETTQLDLFALPNSMITNITRQQKNYYGLTLITGLHHQLNEDLSLGLKVKSPFLSVYTTAELSKTNPTVINGVITQNSTDKRNVPVKFELPWDFGLGTSFSFHPKWKVLLDINYSLSVNYQTTSETGFGEQISTYPTPRFNLGAQYQLESHFFFRTGFFYNPSTIPDLVGKPEGTNRESIYNTSMGIHYAEGNLSTGIGAFYLWSIGESLLSGGNGRIVPVRTHVYGILLTSGYLF